MLRVIDVDYIKDYELLITFNDHSKKKVDLKVRFLENYWIKANLSNTG